MSSGVSASSKTVNFDLLTSSTKDVQRLYQHGQLSASTLVEQTLDQIERHNTRGLNLRALIAVAPRDQLLGQAHKLDEERKNGNIRSHLHGIPFLVKDSIATDPSLGMTTTAGCCALINSKPPRNAAVVDKLLDAGMILIGKSNLTVQGTLEQNCCTLDLMHSCQQELNNFKGDGLMDGWSPVGGQTISAYVSRGIAKGDLPMGHSTPSGSSTGSAVGVSAGFALMSLGLETCGSILSPASRAALYAMKPTIHTVSLSGVLSLTRSLDTVGGMARSPADLAALTTLLQQTTTNASGPSYEDALNDGLNGVGIGFVDETIWKLPDSLCDPNEHAISQMRSEYHTAMEKVVGQGARTQYPVELPQAIEIWPYLGDIMKYECHDSMNEYLESLTSTEVRSLGELVEWNRQHADQELPKEYPSQSSLESSLNHNLTAEANAKNIRTIREMGGRDGVDKVLKVFGLDAIASLSDSPLTLVAAAAGYPICTMPLGTLTMNGRPFGLSVIAAGNQEHKLFQIMGAWETLFSRQAPPALRGEDLWPNV